MNRTESKLRGRKWKAFLSDDHLLSAVRGESWSWRRVNRLEMRYLDVDLSLVLYGWRSLKATVRIRLKARGRRLNSKT